VSEIERLSKVLPSVTFDSNTSVTLVGRTTFFEGSSEELVRTLLRALVGPVEWRLDTPEGAAIMEQRKSAYVAACRQQGCERPADQQGTCALCADIGDHIVEAWIGSVLGEPTHWYADIDFPESEIGKRHAAHWAAQDGRMTVIRETVIPAEFFGDKP